MCFNHRIKCFVSSRVWARAQPGPARALTGGAGHGLMALTGHPAEDSDGHRGEAVAGASVASRRKDMAQLEAARAGRSRNPGASEFRLNLWIPSSAGWSGALRRR